MGETQYRLPFLAQHNAQISKHVLKFDGALIEGMQGKTVTE